MEKQLLTANSIAHFLVDAVCATVVMSTAGNDLATVFFIYNTLAFSTQCMTGLLTDRFGHCDSLASAACVCCHCRPIPRTREQHFHAANSPDCSRGYYCCRHLVRLASEEMRLYLVCFLTMAIETAYFLLIGYRERSFLIVCLAGNLATNLTLNLCIRFFEMRFWLVLLGEIAVVAFEYVIYLAVIGPKRRLLLHTVFANMLSFCVGGMILKVLLI